MKKQQSHYVRAAGGIVYRWRSDGEPEVAVVHRPRYDDWTLPKGKLEEGESVEAAAVREVREETGIEVRLGPVVGETEYRDRHDRRKAVTYYAMAPVSGAFAPNDEVDELRWATVHEALRLLSHDRDREMLAAVMRNPPPL